MKISGAQAFLYWMAGAIVVSGAPAGAQAAQNDEGVAFPEKGIGIPEPGFQVAVKIKDIKVTILR
ncbi:MAG: hypothetical protein GY896_03665 [Gammaproteobacteria bacterium]|nr:hypothetical protein [Gammaproteobacteria bacterium]